MEKLKILIADRNIVDRKQLAEAVERTDFGKVIHISSSGSIALDWLSQSRFDVVLLDVTILKTGGMNILKEIKGKNRDIGIVITGTNAPEDVSVALEALKQGAVDFLLKQSFQDSQLRVEGMKGFLQTSFAQIMIKKYSSSEDDYTGEHQKSPDLKKLDDKSDCKPGNTIPSGFDLLVIASSTGGPRALEKVICELPPDFNKPVLVVQHMPLDFTRALAQSLDKKCNLQVTEAQDREVVQKGKVYIAPGDMHMVVNSENAQIKIGPQSPAVNGVRPSADILFESVAQVYHKRSILAVILTGMGNDGTKGLLELKKYCDCYCITQSESSCIVYGMPKSVCDAGMSDEIADIDMMARRICQMNTGGGSE